MVSTRRSLKKEPEDVDVAVNNSDKKKKGTPTRSSSRNKKKAVLDESPAKEDDEDNNKVKGLFVKGVKMIENIIMGGNNKKKIQQKKRKEDLKSKNTGVGLKISLDSSSSSKITPTNRKIVFDDTNLPSENDDDDDDNSNEQGKKPTDAKDDDDNDDDDDAVEEVQGQAAREKVKEQLRTEEKQSLKSKRKKKRKPRKNAGEKSNKKSKQTVVGDKDDDEDDEDLDEDFFAQLDVVRKEEDKERKELEMIAARADAKGKHTTFVFSQNNADDDAVMNSEPVQIDDNIQVVVLKNQSTHSNATTISGSSSFATQTTATISKTALLYSRNQLIDGTDTNHSSSANDNNRSNNNIKKRKNNRSGEEIKPWKRAKKQPSLGSSRMKKGRPAAFFKKKR